MTSAPTALCQAISRISIPTRRNAQDWNCNESTNPCFPLQWSGVVCENDEVVLIDLSNSELSGEVTPEFFEIPSLQYLNLSNNRLVGTLPELNHMNDKLSVIDLSHNHISGCVPTSWSAMQALNTLILHNNSLQGTKL